MAKTTDIDRAIAQFEKQIAEAQSCIAALRAIQATKAKRVRTKKPLVSSEASRG